MSSSAVRDVARDLVNAVGWPAGLPLKETISEAPDPATLPDSWLTLSFIGQSDDPLGIGPASELREIGTVIVSCLARSGLGDSSLIDLMEEATALIPAHFAASQIYVSSVSPPQESEPGVDGEWLRMDLSVDYQRDHALGE